MKYVKEPPKFEDLGCDPFKGSGFTVQCELEVAMDMRDKVRIQWEYTTRDGEVIDLRDSLVRSFIKISSRMLQRKNGEVKISSLLKAKFLLNDPFLFHLKDNIFDYLKGGSLFCMPNISGSDEVYMTSNFLIMPLQEPKLKPCTYKVVYSVAANKCVVFEDSVRNRIDQTMAIDSNKTHTPRLHQIVDAGAQFSQGDEFPQIVDSTTDDGVSNEVDPGHRPYVIVLGSFGSFFIIVSIIVPIVILALYLKKKCKFIMLNMKT